MILNMTFVIEPLVMVSFLRLTPRPPYSSQSMLLRTQSVDAVLPLKSPSIAAVLISCHVVYITVGSISMLVLSLTRTQPYEKV